MMRNKPTYCERCESLARYRVEKIAPVIDGYYEDEKGDLQVKMREDKDACDVCEECVSFFTIRNYEITGEWKHGQTTTNTGTNY